MYNFKRTWNFNSVSVMGGIPFVMYLVGIVTSYSLYLGATLLQYAHHDLPQRRAPLVLPPMPDHDLCSGAAL